MEFDFRYCNTGELPPKLGNTNHSEGYVVYDVNSKHEWVVVSTESEARSCCYQLNTLCQGRHQVRPIYGDEGSIQPLHWNVVDTHTGEQVIAVYGTLTEAADEAHRHNR